ncbi:YdcF family protein [Chitinibacter sp. S2-10]|uniref:YdcF family protein n=1 Tax=Chitinibacter sp. S2-10 TaxID=3373597 RepID=UPI00397774FA
MASSNRVSPSPFWTEAYIMDLAVLIKETCRALLLPPGSLLLLLAAAHLGRKRWPRQTSWSTISGLLLLYLLATPLVSYGLMSLLETPPLNVAQLKRSQAMVILGGGKRFIARDMPEGETLNNVTLARVRYGARLASLHSQAILVTGGAPLGGMSEAHYMQQVLQNEFGVKVKWVEDRSVDTFENASMSQAMLGPQIKTITLVTSADHMPRARRSFEKLGFEVIAAPTDYINREPFNLTSILPRASALQTSSTALRECLGQIWYALRKQ